VPRAPLHERGVTSPHRDLRGPRQQVLPRLHHSYGLMRQSSPLLVPRSHPQHQVYAGCCQPLLGEGPSRRYLRASVPACLDPYPGGSCGACTRFFPHDIGLPPVRTRSALHNVRTATSVRRPFRGCSHSLMFRPTGVLTTPVAPTATAYTAWQPWFVRPSLSWVVTSPRPGYACRPNRAIDGRGLSPHKMRSLVGCSPNAGAHLLPEAGATQERTLEAVRCSALLDAAWA
jgi:hypothetical protein